MNFGSGNDTSHLFYIIFIIICSLLILNIIERLLLEHIEEKKKSINPIYFQQILNTIKLSKIVLIISLFAIFMIIINPLKLFEIVNINIFSILNDQYTHITDYSRLPECNAPLYLTNKTYLDNDVNNKFDNKFDLNVLDKTLGEWVMNKSDDSIYLRIRKNFKPGIIGENKLCNLIKSIDLDNKLSHINYRDFTDLIEGKSEADNPNLNDELVDLWNLFKNNRNNEEMILDDSQYKKFDTFNKLIDGTISSLYITQYDTHIHFVIIIAIYYLFETIFEIYTFATIEKKKISNNLEIIASGKDYAVNVTEIIVNFLVFLVLLRLLNEKTWLMNTNLMDIYNNRYIPLVLFSTHSISKIIFKFNKYITFDTFIFTKLLSIISTTSIYTLCGLYFWKSFKDKQQKLDMNEYVENKNILHRLTFNYFGDLPTVVLILGLTISIFSHYHTIMYNYYDIKKQQITYKNSEKIRGMIIPEAYHHYLDIGLIALFNYIVFTSSGCKKPLISADELG